MKFGKGSDAPEKGLVFLWKTAVEGSALLLGEGSDVKINFEKKKIGKNRKNLKNFEKNEKPYSAHYVHYMLYIVYCALYIFQFYMICVL